MNRSQKRMNPAYFLTLGLGLAASCAEVSSPPDGGSDNKNAATGGLSTGGQTGTSAGGTVVVVTQTGGAMSMGGSTGGIILVGDGDGDDDMMSRCEEDSDCDSMAGCNVCGLNSVTFLFECMPDATVTDCGGQCVDVQTSNDHCGDCDAACTGDLTCTGGNCECPGGDTQCGDNCTDLQTDTNNCGDCGEVCAGDTPFCTSGECTECAVNGQTDCSGTCRDLETDVNNCGSCGHTCNAANSQVCVDGNCEDPGNCASPDVASYTSGSCGTTTVFNGSLYECIASNLGGCGATGVYCQSVAPNNVPWGSTAWSKLMDCP